MERVARLTSLAAGRWRQALALVAGALLVAWTGWTLSKFVWLLVDGPQVVVDPPETVAVRQAPSFTPAMARGWRLFGDAASVEAAPADGADAPATRLSLQLLGTFSTGNDALAGAVIAERGRDGELYRVGAAVPGGATLERVAADHVLLRRRGQLETLRFDAIASGSGTDAAPASGGIDTLGGFRGVSQRRSRPPEDGSAPAEQSALARFEENLKGNPEGVLDDYGLKPAQDGGYVVGTGGNAEATRALGLRTGDVVLSVNGHALGDVRRDAQLFDEVKASGEARVEIRRGSQTFTVNYPL